MVSCILLRMYICLCSCEGIVSAVRRCMMQKLPTFSADEFALLFTRIKQQSTSIIDLVLSVFGGKMHSDGKSTLIH